MEAKQQRQQRSKKKKKKKKKQKDGDEGKRRRKELEGRGRKCMKRHKSRGLTTTRVRREVTDRSITEERRRKHGKEELRREGRNRGNTGELGKEREQRQDE